MTAKKKTTKTKKDSALGRFVRAIDTAGRDADIARRSSTDPEFRRGVRDDRRATLSSFRTVKDALADRERIQKSKKAKS